MPPTPPMLKQALTSLRHGLEHLAAGSASDRGFAFEHIDQAAELLLKEKVRQLGGPIYRRGHETISLYQAKDTLEKKKVDIPAWAAVEVVRERRDVIHHSGDIPDEDTAQVYLSDAMPFFEGFLRDQFGLDLERHLRHAGVSLPGQPANQVEKLLSEAKRSVTIQPRLSIMTAATALELTARPIVSKQDEKPLTISGIGERLLLRGLLPESDAMTFKKFVVLRNRAAHEPEDPTPTQATFAVNGVAKWIKVLQGARESSDGT